MYCGDCGARVKKNAKFCEECGAKVKTEQKEPKQPMSFKSKMLIVIGLVLITGGVIGYNVLANKLGPEGVATAYLEALMKNKADDIYDSLGLEGDTTFVSKEAFKTIYDEEDNELSDVINYTITNVSYSDANLMATITFEVTREGQTSTDDLEIHVVKKNAKKFLIFDEWEVTNDSIEALGIQVIENYQVRVFKNATVSCNDVTLDKKYYNEEYSSDEEDVYVIPQIFSMEATFKTTLENGLVLEETEEIDDYDVVYTARISVHNISEDVLNTLEEQVTKDMEALYKNLIDKKNWEAVKDSYSSSDLEEEYNNLYQRVVTNASNVLTKFDVTDVTITEVEFDEELEVTARLKYDYAVTNEGETREKDSSTTVTMYYNYKENTFKLTDISGTVKYFSRY